MSWLQTLQRQQAEASRYAYASPSDIQTWSGQCTQLFDSLLVIENYPANRDDSACSLQVENLRSGIVSTYGLTLVVKPGDSPTLVLESQTLDGAALGDVVSEFEDLLKKVIESPTLLLQEILPSAEERGKWSYSRISQPILTQGERPIARVESSADLPRNELELALIQIWQNVLGLPALTADDSFFDLGGNSLLAVQLFNKMQQQLNCTLPIATLFQAPSVRQFAAVLSKDQPVSNWSSLVPIQTAGERPPLFFHGGSADALTWANFAGLLGANQPFYALQRPDLDGSEIVHDTIELLAAACIAEMKMVQPKGPYLVGGHCFGGTVAFEIAQQLTAAGDTVAALIEVDAYCPNAVSHSSLTQLQEKLQLTLFNLRKAYYYHGGKNLTQLPKKIKQRLFPTAPSLETHSQQQLRSISSSSLSSPSTSSYQDRYSRAHYASEASSEVYRPKHYPGPICIFRAKTQILDWHYGYAMGWQNVIEEKPTVVTVPGLFGNLFNQQSGPLLAQQVKDYLKTLPLAPP